MQRAWPRPDARGALRRTGANAGRLGRRWVGRMTLPRERFWLRLRLPSPIPERAPGFVGFEREPALSLLDVLTLLRGVAKDPQVAGVVLRLEGSPGGFARVAALQRAVRELRDAGKPVVAWSETFSAQGLLVAGAATRAFVPESGSVDLVGLRFDSLFLRELLERVGVEPEVVRIGAFKSAGEAWTRDSMSSEHREQLEGLADACYGFLVDGIARDRKLTEPRVRELIDSGPHSAPDAVEAGLIDGCRYPDELEAELAALDGDREPLLVEAGSYAALRLHDPGWRPLARDLPRLAYVVLSGAIHRGRGPRGAAADTLRFLLARLADDDRLAGVVLRIDSPGGDAVASDLIWRAVRQLAEKRPVVASLGDVAASGGYFVAAGCDAIVAEPVTITGSIGVVGARLNVGGLYERLGVRKDGVERGAHSGLLREDRGYTSDERRLVRDEMSRVYELFLDRVGAGRPLSRDEIHRVGQGRIWSGQDALAHRLIDGLGGPLEALTELRRRAGIADDEAVELGVLPQVSRFEALRARLVPSPFG